ncbi:hypothetical protein CDCA_CDCA01G0369 [Cyanidium caldarium]|uniref:Peptidase A1 domain-containing protein n=1 Tax=Cyanidium caldarium TaxID=2771 RepID=A0AAV9IPW7_CYACA|nr:hypothetical protein CDCA_CDCA01G0369 [Cyanidium caldarium]
MFWTLIVCVLLAISWNNASAQSSFVLPLRPVELPASTVLVRGRYAQLASSTFPNDTFVREGLHTYTHAAASLQIAPLYGSVSRVGMYATEISIDGQSFVVSVDTGSSSLAVPTTECLNCPPQKHLLRVDRATTVPCTGSTDPIGDDRPVAFQCDREHSGMCDRTGGCTFVIRYGDGTRLAGRYLAGMVGVAQSSVPLLFGGIQDASGPEKDVFGAGIDGMLGLAYRGLSCNPMCTTPLFDALVERRRVPADMFSLCESDEGGRLVLGGPDPNVRESDIVWTPIVHDLYYNVELDHILVDGQNVGIVSRQSAFVDSGTTMIVLSSRAYATLRDYFYQHHCQVPYVCPGVPDQHTIFELEFCVQYEPQHLQQLPTLTFTFRGNVRLRLSAEQYLLRVTDADGQPFYCLGIMQDRKLGDTFGIEAILGLSWLRNFVTTYDRAHGRIGFTPARGCEVLQDVAEVPPTAGNATDATDESVPDVDAESVSDKSGFWARLHSLLTPTVLIVIIGCSAVLLMAIGVWIIIRCRRYRSVSSGTPDSRDTGAEPAARASFLTKQPRPEGDALLPSHSPV